MGEGVPSMVTELTVPGGSVKKDPWQLVDEGVFQACFQHGILMETNTSLLGDLGVEMCVCIVFIVSNFEIFQAYRK